MANIVDLSKEQDLPGCVSAPLFLSELMRCLSEDVKKPAADMLQIFAEMAQYAAKKDDPRLNVLCLRLGLFKMPPDKLKEALEAEMERIRHPQNKDLDIDAEEVFEPIANAPSYVGSRTYVAGKAYKRVTRLVIETETKENANEQPDSVAKG